MALINKSITLLGATAKVTSFTVIPQLDGTFQVRIAGTANDGASFTEQLATTATFGSGVSVLNNMRDEALKRLRLDNRLEN